MEIIQKQEENTIQATAVIPTWKMPVIIGKTYKDILKYLDKNNVKPAGPPFVRYLDIKWNEINSSNKLIAFIRMFTMKWNLIIGFPVREKLNGEKNLKSGIVPGGKYARTVHRGAYQKVGLTYNSLLTYVANEKLKYKNESMEIYLNDPETTKEEDLETVVLIPLKE